MILYQVTGKFWSSVKLNRIFKTGYGLGLCLLLLACTRTTVTSTPTSSPEPTLTHIPSVTSIATLGITPYHEPTLISTIEPAKISELLNNSFSIQTLDPVNGHNLRRITGWTNGFNSGLWDNNFAGYQWMDLSHLMLFPAVGEIQAPNWTSIQMRPVIINIDTGKVWLPPSDHPDPGYRVLRFLLPSWSPKLGVLITSENIGEGDTTQKGVTTYKSDGTIVARYNGSLTSISPSGTKILIADDIWVDLTDGKKVDFNWGFGVPTQKWSPIWSPDETRIYQCCYFFGDAKTEASYAISDESTILEGHPDTNMQSLHHTGGVWLNDNSVLAQFDGFYTFRNGFFPVFDISARTFRNLGSIANLPDEFNNMPYTQLSISPNRTYMWLSPGAQSAINPQIYLVNLKTLKSQLYHVSGAEWSANGKYAILDNQVLTLSDQIMRTLPALPDSEKLFFGVDKAWNPNQSARLSIYADKQQHMYLYLLDVDALTYWHMTLPSNFSGDHGASIIWSPKGDRFALEASDGSLWLMDYPKINDLSQITPPMANVKDIYWSPDGRYLSFIGGMNIYIVETVSNP
jgi:hypothetical protein